MTSNAPSQTSDLRIDGAYISFAVLLALLSTAISYRYGIGNQQEQLPIILRSVDPAYLANDFFVASSTEFGPRSYFAGATGWLAQFAPLPAIYLLLRFVTDLALIAVTLWGAQRLVGADRRGAMIAAVLVACVSSFHLGDATELRYDLFAPASIAIPGMLLAIGLGCIGRPVAAAGVAVLASLPHPLYGAYAGMAALAAAFAGRLFEGRALAWKATVLLVAPAAALFAAGMLVFWWWPAQSSGAGTLPAEELFAIFAQFRAPHHYLPSSFRVVDYVATALFLSAAGLAFALWRKTTSRRAIAAIVAPLAVVCVVVLAGALFTEVWPSAFAITLQPFRLLSILKWFGYLLCAWMFAEWWRQGAWARLLAVAGMASAGGAFPLVTTAAGAAHRVLPLLQSPPLRLACAAGVLVVSLALWPVTAALDERLRLVAALVLLAAYWRGDAAWRYAGAAFAVATALVVVVARTLPEGAIPSPLQPIVTTEDLHSEAAQAARAAAAHTPTDAVFIAPPGFGVLRIVGERALVVDFEAVPFQNDHMREWRERIRDVYGDTDEGGIAARDSLDQAYRTISQTALLAAAERYGASHAVLYRETPTSFPELYADSTYRIVLLNSGESASHPSAAAMGERSPSQ